MSELVQYTALENGIAIITLNRPESANALSTALLYELSHLLYDLAFRRDVRVVIFTGAGEKVFCAGADLKERAGMNETAPMWCRDEYRQSRGEKARTPGDCLPHHGDGDGRHDGTGSAATLPPAGPGHQAV